jgi:hypothetical protein
MAFERPSADPTEIDVPGPGDLSQLIEVAESVSNQKDLRFRRKVSR